MRNEWAKFHVYTVIVSFIILWSQSISVVMETSKDYVVSLEGDIVVTATSFLLGTKNEKLEMAGLIGWGILGFGVLGVILYGFLNYRAYHSRMAKSSRRRRINGRSVSGKPRKYIFSTTTLDSHPSHGKAVKSAKGGGYRKFDITSYGAYHKYERDIEVRRI